VSCRHATLRRALRARPEMRGVDCCEAFADMRILSLHYVFSHMGSGAMIRLLARSLVFLAPTLTRIETHLMYAHGKR